MNPLSVARTLVAFGVVLLIAGTGPALGAAAYTSIFGQPMPEPGGAAEWGNSFLWAFASSWLMRVWREHPRWGAKFDTAKLWVQRIVAGAVAFAAGCGITVAFDGQAMGGGQLIISGLSVAGVLHGLRQFLFQEFVYHASLKRS